MAMAAVMNFVSKTVGMAFRNIFSRMCAAQSDFGLKVTQPDIYYGEAMLAIDCIDWRQGIRLSKGNDNVYTSYTGKGGIR